MALNFARSGSQHLVANNLPTETGKIAFGYIFKHAANPPGDLATYPNRYAVICKGWAGPQFLNYYIIHGNNGINLTWTAGAAAYRGMDGAWTSDTNEHDVLITADWDNDVFGIWLDGVALSIVDNPAGSFSTTPDTHSTDQLIGRFQASSENFDGDLSELTIWQGCTMNQADADTWHKRQVRAVRSNFRTRCWPFVREMGDLYDNSGISTAVGPPTVVDHPRVIYPWSRSSPRKLILPVGGGGSFNAAWAIGSNSIIGAGARGL